MTVRDRVGRTRYVAFRIVGPPLTRAALSGWLPPIAKLTRFDGAYGVIRTTERDRAELLQVLMGAASVGGKDVKFETLTTSGTLRKAAEALPGDAGRRPAGRRA